MELPRLPLRVTYSLSMDMDARKQPEAELVSFFLPHNTLPWMLPLDLDFSASGWLDLPPCYVCHLLVCFSLLPLRLFYSFIQP
jgi:hypothetical protein